MFNSKYDGMVTHIPLDCFPKYQWLDSLATKVLGGVKSDIIKMNYNVKHNLAK